MKITASVPLEFFESEFLKSEWYKKPYNDVREQFKKLVLEPNLQDTAENSQRRQLLWAWRQPLLERLPADISWSKASISENEFEELLIIREINWERTFGSRKTLRDIAKTIMAGIRDQGAGINIIQDIKGVIGMYPFTEKLIIIATSGEGPYTVLEGNHRAVAFQLKALESGTTSHIPNEILLGVSPNMALSPWLNCP